MDKLDIFFSGNSTYYLLGLLLTVYGRLSGR